LPREFGFLIPIGFRHAPGQTTDAVRNPRGRHQHGEPRGVAHVLDFLRKGDVLIVTRIDRLARSIGDLQEFVRSLGP
jgi:hypothetical protein